MLESLTFDNRFVLELPAEAPRVLHPEQGEPNPLSTPYSIEHESTPLANRRPEWARNRAGCSMLSCSS